MNPQHVTFPLALIAGLLSFFSPCILPLVPVYIGYLTGTSVTAFGETRQRNTLLHALFFVLGFGLVFVLLGVAAGLIGQTILPIMPYVVKVGGAVLIIFGLHMTGFISIPLLNLEKRLDLPQESSGYWASALVGMIFAAGWTPCVGPILSAILLMAANSKTAANGALLLTTYTLGLGVPFLITAALVDVALPTLKRMNRHTRLISVIAGGLLIIMGLLLLTGRFEPLLFWLNANIRI
ncbi:MAG: cytochrome c biogenesis CcdA family protein [Chloroflexota bacterium]